MYKNIMFVGKNSQRINQAVTAHNYSGDTYS